MKHLANKQLTKQEALGLCKIGNIVAPGHKNLPKFSSTQLASHANLLLLNMHPKDATLFKTICAIAPYLPSFLIQIIYHIAFWFSFFPNKLGSPFRKFIFGTKAFVYSLYYSHYKIDHSNESILDLINFSVSCKEIPSCNQKEYVANK